MVNFVLLTDPGRETKTRTQHWGWAGVLLSCDAVGELLPTPPPPLPLRSVGSKQSCIGGAPHPGSPKVRILNLLCPSVPSPSLLNMQITQVIETPEVQVSLTCLQNSGYVTNYPKVR